MAKTKISEYDSTAANNTDIDGINIAEGMSPSNVNNALREQMAHLKDGLGAGTPVFLDQTNNRLGVGTSNPFTTLEIESAGESLAGLTSHMEISHNSLSANTGGALVLSSNNNRHGAIKGGSNSGGGTGYLSFHTRPSSGDLDEAIRIDSDQNLFVGKTSSSTNSVGSELKSDGQAVFVRDAAVPVVVNRKTDDGVIIQVRKDNSTIGNIGVHNTSLVVGKGDTGVKFNPDVDSIYPWDIASNNTRDAAIDLGYSTHRFQDLYLSGGAYIGGTGASNKLEDYEEGTFTPTLTDASSGITPTYITSFTTGRYTKIGNIVNFALEVRTSSVSGGSSAILIIGGLPFTRYAGNYDPPFMVNFYNVTFDVNHLYNGEFNGGGTTNLIFRESRNGAASGTMPSSAWSSSNPTLMRVTGTYEIN